MDLGQVLLIIKKLFIYIIQYGLPIVAFVISLLSFLNSRKDYEIQTRILEVEEKIKKYELEDKEREREEETKVCIEARVINISKDEYYIRFWNSGKATACNVDFRIDEEYPVDVFKQKAPMEFLEPVKSFDEILIVTLMTPRKFKVTTTWEDNHGNIGFKDQFVTI